MSLNHYLEISLQLRKTHYLRKKEINVEFKDYAFLMFVAVASITLTHSERYTKFKNRRSQHSKGIDSFQKDLQIGSTSSGIPEELSLKLGKS